MGAARNHTPSAIVIEGDAGIGKTTLADAFVDQQRAFDVRFLRVTGYSSEADLPYAAVDRLLRDLESDLAALPERLRLALRIATGRESGDPPDRFQIGHALTSLLSELDGVTVVVVDDAHLVDEASLGALAFVARRIRAEALLLVFVTRPELPTRELLSGVETLSLAGLDPLSAVELLNARRESMLDPHLAMKVVEQLDGHPLAILDLAEHADAGRVALRALSIEPLPPGALLQGLYRREIQNLPRDAQDFALLAVTDTTGDVGVLRDAAAALGLAEAASRPLETAGLVSLDERITFRHQLVRAAVYNGAPLADRMRAHVALEAASDRRGFHAAATMHAATAAPAPDEAVATRLEALAADAGARGALLARAGLLVRAAQLSPAKAARDERRLAAAEAALGAGAAVLAREQLGALDDSTLDPLHLGRLLTARALLAMFIADAQALPHVVLQLTSAADAFDAESVELMQRSLLSAFSYALATESATQGISIAALGERIGHGAARSTGAYAIVLAAMHAHLLLPFADAAPLIRAAVDAALEIDDDTLMALGLCVIPLALAVWDWRRAVELSRRLIDTATARGALRALDTMHWSLSTLHVQLVDAAAASRSLENVRELRRAIGYPAEHVVNAGHLALTGVPLEIVDAVAASILSTGFAGAWTGAQSGIAARLIADGDYAGACERLEPAIGGPFPHVARLALPDFVEAAARSGRVDEAVEAAATLTELARVAPTPWIDGLALRSTALVTPDDDAEAVYLRAIEALSAARAVGDLARAHLLYGEWLRRQRRRREARQHLAIAVRSFDALDAVAFAQRARHEFSATGETVPPPSSPADLTPQEALVAGLARDGKTNHEIAAALFISPNTVDYHLRKVYRKLGIASRKQLLDGLHG